MFKLKAKHDNALIQVEYEVDTNRVGQAWAVRLTISLSFCYSNPPWIN